jgi:hypothetical protein
LVTFGASKKLFEAVSSKTRRTYHPILQIDNL